MDKLRSEVEQAYAEKLNVIRREFAAREENWTAERTTLMMRNQELEAELDEARITHFAETTSLQGESRKIQQAAQS